MTAAFINESLNCSFQILNVLDQKRFLCHWRIHIENVWRTYWSQIDNPIRVFFISIQVWKQLLDITYTNIISWSFMLMGLFNRYLLVCNVTKDFEMGANKSWVQCLTLGMIDLWRNRPRDLQQHRHPKSPSEFIFNLKIGCKLGYCVHWYSNM